MKITYPGSEKVYLPGQLYPELRVAMRRVTLTPTVTVENGEKVFHENAPVYVYDTSGPYSDPAQTVDLRQGLPRLREPWILARGGVERLAALTSEYGRQRQADPKRRGLLVRGGLVFGNILFLVAHIRPSFYCSPF